MRKAIINGIYTGALAASLWAQSAAAVNAPNQQIPYFGVSAGYMLTDSVRRSDNGAGIQYVFGVPLQKGSQAVEIRLFDFGYDRDFDGKENYQTGLFVDFVNDYGPLDDANPDGFFSGAKPFAHLGVGFIEEDTFDDKHIHLSGNVGGGLLFPLGFKDWALRLEARIQPQLNKESCQPVNAPSACRKDADSLLDYQMSLGLQLPMSWFFDRPAPVASGEDCPIAVVDPSTGRRDCAADSDRDGVSDPRDECPGTPSGGDVDAQGCPRNPAEMDSDGDGVVNAQDRCFGTQSGLEIDAAGCAIEQRVNIEGVIFEPDSSRLTGDGRAKLGSVAAMLKNQTGLKVEIAGHTDAVGSEAYNTLLSQQRADAVRGYLIERGVEESRLTASGYGEAEPVASNDTEENRARNRRVELRITTEP